MFNTSKAREIRAVYDSETITVYQAYNSAIASAATEHQRLDASPSFKPARMTWIKPSWNWMMYRSGYSYKDKNQAHILAIRMSREYFHSLLSRAVLSESDETRRGTGQIRIQWDPERSIRIERLTNDGSVRSIQIGIPAEVVPQWVEKGIVAIEDVTEKARRLSQVLTERKDVTTEELVQLGLVPVENVYALPDEIANVVGITK